MNKIFLLLLVTLLSLKGFGQQPDSTKKVHADTLIKKLDSLNIKNDSTAKQLNNTTEAAYNPQTRITFKTYFILLGSTIKQEYTKPFHMSRREWGQLGLFTVAAAGLAFTDEPVQRQALKFRATNSVAVKVSNYITNTGGQYEMITLAALGAYGFIFKNEKMRTTTLLATQAYITGTLVETTVKYLTGRTRPSTYGADVEAEPRFKGPFSKKVSNSSFPSGHATVAFAAATVYAMEYKKTIWVPILAYSAATLISASRITENKHWTTDVFVGAVLGYLNGRHVVNNYHRYAKIKQPGKNKNSVSFNLQYDMGQFRPGLVYHIN
ncbi:MAG TPA: phosphatase PAP2 family protein [Ferruginibacter sp.]|jgi:membrane-associated phospholipid phosphatase|nr:phosphatase PAP2 family protein [Ferruginibacter sp.]